MAPGAGRHRRLSSPAHAAPLAAINLAEGLTSLFRAAMSERRDIAHEAATLLAGLEFEDKSTRELLGPRDYSLDEATCILGAALGQPDLRYVRVSDEQARQGMIAQGLPPHMADMLLEMYRAIDSGKVHRAEPRLRARYITGQALTIDGGETAGGTASWPRPG